MFKKADSIYCLLFLLSSSPGIVNAATVDAVNEVRSIRQDEKCTGIIKDATGEAVIGASVVVKGTTNGTITGLDGDFILDKVKKGDIISVSFVGYVTQEIKWNGQPITITLVEDSQTLDEVVVTALGMKRDAKALGYAMKELKGDELNSNVINPVSALQGKVAGVDISQSDGGLFGSNKILIRGASTLNSNNQPIYVVDGVILDNSVYEGDADYSTSSSDYGNELKNLNPDDFETVSVLKGAAATALYGSRGLNGAVVITTKSGKGKKGIGVNFSQTFGVDVLTSSPNFQNTYGEGYLPGYVSYGEKDENGDFYIYNTNQFYTNANGDHTLINHPGGLGWGPAYDGTPIEYYDGTMRPYVAYKNNYKDAYQAGFNSNTNFSISGGNDRTTFYTSVSYKYAEGTTPNNTFNRISLLGKASHKLTDKVELEGSISFANSTPRNAQKNIGEYFIDGTFTRSYDSNDRMHYKGPHGGLASSSYGDEYGYMPGTSLWWSIYENEYKQKETSVRPSLKLNIDLLDWLKFSAEGNYNYYYTRYEDKQAGSGYANEGGYYGIGNTTKEQTNLNATFNANKSFGDFEVHGFLRGEYYHSFTQTQSMNTDGGLIAHNQYFINNSMNDIKYSAAIEGEKTMLSIAGQVGASWKDQLFLDITGRNDWSSSLVYRDGHGTYSYFYPSVSGSWLISTTFRDKLPSWISFAKVRGSWAQVGNDTDPYIINTAYTLNTSTVNSNKVYATSLSNTTYSNNLKPERKNSWEVGLDWRFINNRIGIDFTYYKENTYDQIMKIEVPSVSGQSYQYVNAGNIQNAGVELAINTTPIETKDWQWDLNFTYTKNNSKIIALHENVADYIILAGDPQYGNYRIGSVAKVGGEYGLLITDSAIKYDSETGLPVLSYNTSTNSAYYTRSGEITEIGSINPDFLGSLSTSLRYKNWSLSVSLDARFGGYVASYGSRYGTAYGFTASSLQYRDTESGGMTYTSMWDGLTYSDGVIPEGIFLTGTSIPQPDGSSYTVGTGAASTGETFRELMDKGVIEPTHASAWHYRNNQWTNPSYDYGVVNDTWFTKLNYIALREISLSYRFPQRMAEKIKSKGLTLTATGRNLGYLLNSMPNGENPESVRGTSAGEFRIRSFDGVTSSFTLTINASF